MKLDYSFEMIIFIIGNIHVLTNVYNVYFKNKCLLIHYCMPDYQFIITIVIRLNAVYDFIVATYIFVLCRLVISCDDIIFMISNIVVYVPRYSYHDSWYVGVVSLHVHFLKIFWKYCLRYFRNVEFKQQ